MKAARNGVLLRWCGAVLLVGAVASTSDTQPARADELTADNASASVQVSIQAAKTHFARAERVVIEVQFTNNGTADVLLPKWLLEAGGIDRSFLQVTRGGVPVTYLGALVKRTDHVGKHHRLVPGTSINASYDLSAAFDLSAGGHHEVSLQSLHAPGLAEGLMKTSNTLGIEVPAGTPPAPVLVPADPTFSSISTSLCSTTETNQAKTAYTAAQNYANNSYAYLTAGTKGTRFTTWFGVYSSSRYGTATSHFSAIANAFSTKSVVVDCSCKDDDVYAYVYPTRPYKIYVCGAFWDAPNTGTDSRGGTLVHEMSHFQVVSGTGDYVYGQSGARSLASRNPSTAVANADNHEYFAENNPAGN